MKIFLCAAAALTLSVCTMNAQEKADVINASKTQVVKKVNQTQEVKKAKVVTKKKRSSKAVIREDAEGANGNHVAPKKKQVKKAVRAQQGSKRKAKVVKKSESDLINEKKAKQTVKKVDN